MLRGYLAGLVSGTALSGVLLGGLSVLSDLPGDAFDAADFFLEEAGVAMTPGPDFGSNAEECLRVSYANSAERLAEASERIQRALERVEISAAD